MSSDRRRTGILSHIVRLGLGLGLVVAIVAVGGLEGLQNLGALDPLFVLVALASTLGIVAAIAVRWRLLLHAMVHRRVARFGDYVHYFLVSRLLGYVLPKDASDIGSRVAHLSRVHGVPVSQAGGSVVFDRLFDALTVGLAAVAAFAHWLGWFGPEEAIGVMVGLAVVVGGVLAAAHRPLMHAPIRLFNATDALVRRIARRDPRPDGGPLAPERLGRGVVVGAYVASVAKFAITAIRNVAYAAALGLPIPAVVLVLASPLAQLAYLVAFTPGGLGIFEAGWVGTLRMAEVELATATAFAVGHRVLTLAFIASLTATSHVLRVVLRREARG